MLFQIKYVFYATVLLDNCLKALKISGIRSTFIYGILLNFYNVYADFMLSKVFPVHFIDSFFTPQIYVINVPHTLEVFYKRGVRLR